jgi:hypothetical protein
MDRSRGHDLVGLIVCPEVAFNEILLCPLEKIILNELKK